MCVFKWCVIYVWAAAPSKMIINVVDNIINICVNMIDDDDDDACLLLPPHTHTTTTTNYFYYYYYYYTQILDRCGEFTAIITHIPRS
ncbi:hypothetical protein OAV88_01615 [bacterium]|nr:hypothetical protein [bacterium]